MLNPIVRANTISEGNEEVKELHRLSNEMLEKLNGIVDHSVLVENITNLQNEVYIIIFK